MDLLAHASAYRWVVWFWVSHYLRLKIVATPRVDYPHKIRKGKTMTTQVIPVNSYKVTFVFDYTTITTNVFAMHQDACADMAADIIYGDMGLSNLSSLLNSAQDIEVELIDENVL